MKEVNFLRFLPKQKNLIQNQKRGRKREDYIWAKIWAKLKKFIQILQFRVFGCFNICQIPNVVVNMEMKQKKKR